MREPGPHKIHVPDADFKPHRRATSQHSGALAAVPFGVQMVQRFTNGEKDNTVLHTTSTRDKAKRTSSEPNIQPQKAALEHLSPETQREGRPRK